MNTYQNTRNHLHGGPHYKMCLQNHFWFVDTHTDRQTDRQTDTLKTIPAFRYRG